MTADTGRQPLPEHIDQNIDSVVAIQKRDWEHMTAWQKRVERIGRFVARPSYIVGLLLLTGAWIVLNIGLPLVGRGSFDPFPFPLLDGLLTLCALLTSTVVLIAQGRQAKLEQHHTHLDLQVTLLTEQKVSKLIRLLEELRHDLPMVRDRHDPQASVLQEAADTEQVLTAIEQGGLTSQNPASDEPKLTPEQSRRK
jgi:uncharacterized membrane protein